ncbi:hypothetical protein BV25DRAFT_95956 [Artomyces pyxidatus]|uniref:Uncharacterized protein n=1 Tax=Artomyces pyxidatus TaxID=48021 RepID=A0ACB8TL12_9AGAM|nr:hypothetical protein BV25DRAFT_95956 [Artomyces pyxidatus]
MWPVLPLTGFRTILVGFLAIMALAVPSATAVLTYYSFPSTQRLLRDAPRLEKNIWIGILVVESVLDLTLTATLIYILGQHEGEFPRSNNVFERLRTFFFTRGIILTMFQVVVMILSFAVTHSTVYLAFLLSLGQVYANSALMTLNNRKYLREADPNCHFSTMVRIAVGASVNETVHTSAEVERASRSTRLVLEIPRNFPSCDSPSIEVI